MKKNFFRKGCLTALTLTILLLFVAGSWWFLRSQRRAAEASPSSPVLVYLLSPSDGDETHAGDFVPVTLQAAAPAAILSAELFVDGQSVGAVSDSPENAFWSWRAWPAGIHTMSARVTAADGQVGQSQTVIVSVLEADGPLQVFADEGQTLEQVGAKFGVPADQMAGANPHVDPSGPLAGGQPVQVPTGGETTGEAPDPSQPNGNPENVSIPFLIDWKIQFNEPVDKSYCYISLGDGDWDKMPKMPFDFFFGEQVQYPLYKFTVQGLEQADIQMQCWGWLGGQLKYLGEGGTSLDIRQQPPQELAINTASFQALGMPQMKPLSGSLPPEGENPQVTPPFALREAQNGAECTSHFPNPVAGAFVCDGLLNAPLKEYYTLVWEWQPKMNWPGYQDWLNEIDGYVVYQIEPGGNPALIKRVEDPNQKVTAVPIPWGGFCYGVEAYENLSNADHTYTEEWRSEMVTYCPGQPPTPKKITVSPTNWLTTGGQWIQDGDCDTYGETDSYLHYNKNTGFGNQPGEVLVGSYLVDDDEKDCYREGKYSGAVKFGSLSLPSDAVVQKAFLRFSMVFNDYNASGVALGKGENPLCASSLSKAKQDWTALDGGSHFGQGKSLYPYRSTEITSALSWGSQVDVTPFVKGWIKHPEENHGFVLDPGLALKPAVDGSGSCMSGATSQLDIYYFTP